MDRTSTPDDYEGHDNANALDGEARSWRDRLAAIDRMDDDEADAHRIPLWVERAKARRLPAKVYA